MEFTTIAIQYLKACNIQHVHSAFVHKQMPSHPDYPSLLSFTIISFGSNSNNLLSHHLNDIA